MHLTINILLFYVGSYRRPYSSLSYREHAFRQTKQSHLSDCYHVKTPLIISSLFYCFSTNIATCNKRK